MADRGSRYAVKPTADEALQGPVRRTVDQLRAVYKCRVWDTEVWTRTLGWSTQMAKGRFWRECRSRRDVHCCRRPADTGGDVRRRSLQRHRRAKGGARLLQLRWVLKSDSGPVSRVSRGVVAHPCGRGAGDGHRLQWRGGALCQARRRRHCMCESACFRGRS